MPVTINTDEREVTALLEGEIDHCTAKGMRQAIDAAVIRIKPQCLYLDFSRVVFMDSSGIGLIMGRHRLLSETGGRVEIRNVPQNLMKMMRIAGLGRLGIKGI